MSSQSVKVIIVGDRGVGKTTFINYLATGVFDKKYNATEDVIVNEVKMGDVKFNCWDISSDKKEYYKNADSAIVMFDVTSRKSFISVEKWINDINSVCGNIPIVICGNKIDYNFSRDITTTSSYHYDKEKICNKFSYFSTSPKADYNTESPFLHIIKVLNNKQ